MELLKAGIYATIAVALKGGEWREASMVMMVKEIAAKPSRKEAKQISLDPSLLRQPPTADIVSKSAATKLPTRSAPISATDSASAEELVAAADDATGPVTRTSERLRRQCRGRLTAQ